VWEVVETWLKDKGAKVKARQPNVPIVEGVLPNAGFA